MPQSNLWRAVPTVAAALLLSTVALGATTAHAAPLQVLIANDTLYVGASDLNDLLLIRPGNGTQVRVDLGADGNDEYVLDGTRFSSIDVSAEGGDDRVLVPNVEDDLIVRGGTGNDQLHGGRGSDVLDGGEGNDVLWSAPGGADTLLGGSGYGWDTIGFTPMRGETITADGGEGKDTFVVAGAPVGESMSVQPGTAARHLRVVHDKRVAAPDAANFELFELRGEGGGDTLEAHGGLGPEVQISLYGGTDNDVLTAGDNVTRFYGGLGADRLNGGAKRDLFYGFDDDREVFGGAGPDSFYVDYAQQTGPVADYLPPVPVNGGFGEDSYEVVGSPLRDTVGAVGHGTFEYLRQRTTHQLTGIENASFRLGDGDDSVEARSTVPMPLALMGENGNDTLVGGGSSDLLSGGPGVDNLDGRSGDDTLHWSTLEGNDVLTGGDGHDVARAFGTGGPDRFIVYTPPTGPEQVTNTVTHANAKLSTLELLRVDTGDGPDTVSTSVDLEDASSIPLHLEGGAGDDVLAGGRGADRVDGGEGDDELYGLQGNDTVLGGEGDDNVYWNSSQGADVVDGGSGADYLAAQTSDLADNVTVGPGRDGQLQLRNALTGGQVVLGGLELVGVQLRNGDDTFLAGNGIRGLFELRVDGGLGRDRLTGGDGDDLLSGGPGLDELDGRGGADTYQCGGSGDWFVEEPGDIVADDCR